MENLRFAFGILMISIIFLEIYVVSVWVAKLIATPDYWSSSKSLTLLWPWSILPGSLPYALACRRRWLAGLLRNGTTEKIELNPISTEERLRQLTNCTERNFLALQRNFTTAERRNGNRRTQRNGISNDISVVKRRNFIYRMLFTDIY